MQACVVQYCRFFPPHTPFQKVTNPVLTWFPGTDFQTLPLTEICRAVTDHWDKYYNPRTHMEEVDADPDSEDLFDMQMKRAKRDTKDELKTYLSELPVKSSTLTDGVLGWWKVKFKLLIPTESNN